MKVKRDTGILVLFLYPFVALPLGFLMFSMAWATDLTFIIAIGLATSGTSILVHNLIKEKFVEKTKHRSNISQQSFYSKNKHRKLTLKYA